MISRKWYADLRFWLHNRKTCLNNVYMYWRNSIRYNRSEIKLRKISYCKIFHSKLFQGKSKINRNFNIGFFYIMNLCYPAILLRLQFIWKVCLETCSITSCCRSIYLFMSCFWHYFLHNLAISTNQSKIWFYYSQTYSYDKTKYVTNVISRNDI